jgi:hypothetical protein
MKRFFLFVSFFISPVFLQAAGSSEATTLFVIGETSGQFVLLAKEGKPIMNPKFEPDKTSDSQFIQVLTDEKEGAKYYWVTNSGTTEVVMTLVGKAMVFISITENMHSTLTVCMDRQYSDGAFLAVETMVRPNAFSSGATTARVFNGKAKPSPILATFLKSQQSK